MKHVRSAIFGTVVAAIAVGLAACVETAWPEASLRTSPPSDRSVVIGQFAWFHNGAEEKIPNWNSSVAPEKRILPQITRVDDGTSVTGILGDDGHFRWSLKKGVYLIDSIGYRAADLG